MAKFKSSAKSDAPTAARKRSPAKKTAKPAASTTKKASESTPTLGLGAQTIMDSAQLIWQTGVNALGRAQQESTRLFEALVKEGVSVEQKTRSMATDKVSSVRGSVETRVDQVKDRASDTWDRLEKLFEERVQRALTRLGVPGREELQGLINRVDELNARLRELSATPTTDAAPRAKPATAKPVAKKPAAKKATTKKAPAKKAPVKKTAAKKAPAKKAAAKPSVAKQSATSKTAAKPPVKKAAKKAAAKPGATTPTSATTGPVPALTTPSPDAAKSTTTE